MLLMLMEDKVLRMRCHSTSAFFRCKVDLKLLSTLLDFIRVSYTRLSIQVKQTSQPYTIITLKVIDKTTYLSRNQNLVSTKFEISMKFACCNIKVNLIFNPKLSQTFFLFHDLIFLSICNDHTSVPSQYVSFLCQEQYKFCYHALGEHTRSPNSQPY